MNQLKLQKLKHKYKLKHWISGTIKQMIKQRQKYYLLFKHKVSNIFYKMFKNYVTSKIRSEKKLYHKKLLLFSVMTDIRKTWIKAESS